MDQPTPATLAPVDAPPDRPPLATAVVQLAAAVIVQKNGITSVPPHLAACVVLKDDPSQIVAIVGPQGDLASVQDSVVFSQAYALRAALRELVKQVRDMEQPLTASVLGAMENAEAALDAATPQFMSMQRPSAEQQLADARKDYDPTLNPSTAGILSVEGVAVEDQDEAGATVHTPFTH